MSQRKIELEIIALSHSVTHSHNYAVLLGETEGPRRRLPIVIGAQEAQAIAIAMENMAPNRPLTHDLFKNTLSTFHITLKEVRINKLLEGVFHALLVCEKDGGLFEIDSRTSDALALAVRFECPIYTYANILDEAGITVEEEGGQQAGRQARRTSSTPPMPREKRLKDMSLDELNQALDKALGAEQYEQAALIRDEIQRRDSTS